MTLRRRRHEGTRAHTHQQTHTLSPFHCVFCIHKTVLNAYKCNWLSPSAADGPTGPEVLCHEHPTLSPLRRAPLNAIGGMQAPGAEISNPSRSLGSGTGLGYPGMTGGLRLSLSAVRLYPKNLRGGSEEEERFLKAKL